MPEPETYRALAEPAGRWVLSQVRRDGDDVWLPEPPAQWEPCECPYGMHSGSDGLAGAAHVVTEVSTSSTDGLDRRARPTGSTDRPTR